MDEAQQHPYPTYQIVVQGKLDDSWAAWLDGMAIARAHARDGTPLVVLTGPVADQAALRGLLSRLWDLNLSLIAIAPVGASRSGAYDEPERGT
jgi:hypothetical protein